VVVHALLLLATLTAPASSGDLAVHDTSRPAAAVASVPDDEATTEDAPPPTFNEFLPEDRSITDCISALPRPGCGSEARGGWRQRLVLYLLVLGLSALVILVARSARRMRPTTTQPSDDAPGPVRHALGRLDRSVGRLTWILLVGVAATAGASVALPVLFVLTVAVMLGAGIPLAVLAVLASRIRRTVSWQPVDVDAAVPGRWLGQPTAATIAGPDGGRRDVRLRSTFWGPAPDTSSDGWVDDPATLLVAASGRCLRIVSTRVTAPPTAAHVDDRGGTA
jgi:hypothetical protein